MNKKLANLDSDTSSFVKPGEGKNLSKNAQFYIYNSLFHSKPILGDNEITMRFVYANTLVSLSDKAKITVIYSMPEMPQMGEEKENATLQSDGTFLTTLFFSMAGRWHIILKIEDDSVQDEYAFEITL
ncbi:MAG: FixH family protein [Deltaproteobacteria bacterium]|nr:FixH family protein [Deltaproteobacteria bacterium]